VKEFWISTLTLKLYIIQVVDNWIYYDLPEGAGDSTVIRIRTEGAQREVFIK
jgi:hypothetical protein